MICDKLDINVWELIQLANRHPRVNILQPGPGVGGHCIAVDPWFIVSETPEDSRLIRTAREVNDMKPKWVVEKVKEEINNLITSDKRFKVENITIACYGLAFKPDIDDLRESPSVQIAKSLENDHSGTILLVEPNISKLPDFFTSSRLCSMEYAMESADIHILLVNHKQFLGMSNFPGVKIDLKGIWDEES